MWSSIEISCSVHSPCLKSCNVAGTDIQLSDKVKILGATLDSNLTMEPHTKALSSSCFYHIRSLEQICWSLDGIVEFNVPLNTL